MTVGMVLRISAKKIISARVRGRNLAMKSPLRLLAFLVAVSVCAVCASSDGVSSSLPSAEITIPGPLRSFLRMAGISQKASPQETMALLSNEVNLRGYFHGKPTEFLTLLLRYLQQVTELVALAGPL